MKSLFCCLLALFFLSSCGNPQIRKPAIDPLVIISEALSEDNDSQTDALLAQQRFTENAQNLIQFYRILEKESFIKLNREINYLLQFYPQMNPVHQSMLDEMIRWILLKQIYRDEVYQPVRILQREKLYLAPSNIDISLCENMSAECSVKLRQLLLKFMTLEDITKSLKKMALKDPCVNLSRQPQDEVKANRCINMRRENMVIELLPKPQFSTEIWLQALKQ